jgi:hypothetical protein
MNRRLLHFVLIGSALFAVQRALPNDTGVSGEGRTVVVSSARVEELRRRWLESGAGWPGPAQMRAMIEEEVEEEILFREAMALGLHETDDVVRRRLLQNMKFLSAGQAWGTAGVHEDRLYRDALSLGMAHTDLVVRRRLIQRMRLHLAAPVLAAEPSEAEMRAHLAEHREQFAAPRRAHLSHLFFSRRGRGEAAVPDATHMRSALESGTLTAERASSMCDPHPWPLRLRAKSRRQLATAFGAAFADAVFDLEPGRWHGPVASAHGVHLVFVHRVEESPVLPLPRVRAQVRAAVRAQRVEAALSAAMRRWRAHYRVRVEGT